MSRSLINLEHKVAGYPSSIINQPDILVNRISLQGGDYPFRDLHAIFRVAIRAIPDFVAACSRHIAVASIRDFCLDNHRQATVAILTGTDNERGTIFGNKALTVFGRSVHHHRQVNLVRQILLRFWRGIG